MNIKRYETPYWQSNTYTVVEGKEMLIIDPCRLSSIEKQIEDSIIPKYAILTHEHCDHIIGTDWVRSLGAVVVCSEVCGKRITNPKTNAARYFNITSQIQKNFKTEKEISEDFSTSADIMYKSELKIKWLDHEIYFRNTPGHTPGSSCILIDNMYFFSGDTILPGEEINTRFEGGSRKEYDRETLPWLRQLPKDIIVYPGHFNSFLLKDAKGIE